MKLCNPNNYYYVLLLFILKFSDGVEQNKNGGNYWHLRLELLEEERLMSLGGQIKLTGKELQVNKIVLACKLENLNESYRDEAHFLPTYNFAQIKDNITETKMFKIIKSLPKGANLHLHPFGAVSYDFIVKNLTYKEDLYGCYNGSEFNLKFFASNNDSNCEWRLLKDIRKIDQNFDEWLIKNFTFILFENEDGGTINRSWNKFKQYFSTFYDLFTYRPVFEDLLYQSLLELYQDNVNYMEFRGGIYKLYEINNGTIITHDAKYFFDIFEKVVRKFRNQHKNFVGARYICSFYRGVDNYSMLNYIEEMKDVKELYQDSIAGFDLVGFEDDGKPLSYFADLFPKEIKYFFHAGETKWYGHTDMNLVDAVLLNATRIGHAYALLKHPKILELVKERNIGIEVCPISNQILLSLKDLRDHPAVAFIAQNLPIVICNDDPGVWGSTGLSYDWYLTFMAMTSKNAGLEVLKQLAMNSIMYSAMPNEEKVEYLKKWAEEWDTFLNHVLLLRDL